MYNLFKSFIFTCTHTHTHTHTVYSSFKALKKLFYCNRRYDPGIVDLNIQTEVAVNDKIPLMFDIEDT